MRAARMLALILAAVAIGVIAGVLILGRDDRGQPERLGDPRGTVAISTSLEPRVHLFGDPVIAHLDLLFDRRRVDPDRIVVDAVFRPYEQLGRQQRTRSDVGDTVKLRISYQLQCLARACAPRSPRREIRFPPVRVLYVLADVRARANDVAEWPPIGVASRLGPFDIQEAAWRADLQPPAVSYGVSPGWLAAGLGGASFALVGAAAWLAWGLLGRAAAEELKPQPIETRSPLERALENVGVTAANGAVPERRRALERLARELERAQETGLAARARRLAWSPANPDRPDVERLADDVRSGIGGPG